MHVAVIETGGKQYLVHKGSKITTETLKGKEGEAVSFPHVLLLGDDAKHTCDVGTPYLSKVKVSGKILSHGKNKKVRIGKFKNKVRYRRNRGHRQPHTVIEITSIAQ